MRVYVRDTLPVIKVSTNRGIIKSILRIKYVSNLGLPKTTYNKESAPTEATHPRQWHKMI